MHLSHGLALLLLLLPVLRAAPAAGEIDWVDATSLTVEGRGWADTEGPYDRLPPSAQERVNETAWGLSRESAGVCVRFLTDAAAVQVRWSVGSDALDMPHMPATGVSGVDLYTRGPDGGWRFVANGRPGSREDNQLEAPFPDGGREARECLLYLPLYNRTASLAVGVAEGCRVDPAPPRPAQRRAPVVVYGTSITQGGCASRPGMAWPAILGRLIDREVVNLGFSGSGRMEPPVGTVLAEVDAALYLIDCTWNMGDSQEVYHERVGHLVRSLRERHPDTPILFVGQSHIRPEAHPTDLTQRLANAVKRCVDAGVTGLTLVPGEGLAGDDGEATVDGVHLTDLGMDRQARALLPWVREALGAPASIQAD